MSTVNIEAEAWRLLLSGAESHVEDALGDRQYDPPFDALSALADAARIVNGADGG